MKRWIAFFLTLAMALSVLAVPASARAAEPTEEPIYVFTEEDNARIEQDVFAGIENVKTNAAKTCGGIGRMTEQDYVALIPQVIEVIENSETYVPGTLQQNGNFLVWQTTVGLPCCYDPRMEAKLHNTEDDPTPEDIALAEARADALLEELSEIQGGWPSSTKIGLIQPYWDSPTNYEDSSFNDYSPSYKAAWQALSTATGGEGIRFTMSNATVDNVAYTLSQCGLVMFDSHGSTDWSSGDDAASRANTSYLCLTTNAGVTSQDTQPAQGLYDTYYHCLSGSGYAFVDGTCIANHMNSNAPHSFLYMGICLGMATDGMESGLRAKGVEAVWGYSRSVTFYGDEKYVASLMRCIKEGDELGEAAAAVKEEYGYWDPAYPSYTCEQAVENYVAFPVVASSEDPYPERGTADSIQIVNSTWTLFTQYDINAVCNHEGWGTVTVSGHRITATPNTGYALAGYEILEGECTVTQNGNVFRVDAQTDCTVQINFSARTPATVIYDVPEGVSCENFNGYIDDTTVLPVPTGAPAANAHDYHFLGWTTAPVEDDVTTIPGFVKAGTEPTVTEPSVTYYALYSYFIAEDGYNEGEFTLVDAPRANWSGEYVVTYQGEKVLDASGSTTGSAISSAAADMSEVGGVLNGNILSNVNDDYIYVVEEVSSGVYSIKMKEPDVWLALITNSNSLNTADSDDENTARWTFAMGEDGVKISSVEYPERSLRFNPQANAFRCYKQGQQPVALYASAPGVKYYTTVPKNAEICDVHSFGDWTVATAPTCTEAGEEKRVCAVCGYTETRPVDALGHEYGDWIVTTEPTCTEAGEETRTCIRCDAFETRPVEPLGHDYAAVVTEPTCTEAGFTTYTCSRCNDSYTGDETEALGHDWDEGTVTVEPSYQASGVKTFTCARCGETKTEEIEKLANPFEDVHDEDFFFNPVMWALDESVTGGIDETHFAPEKTVMRADSMVFFWAANGRPEFTATDKTFKDVKKNHWAYKAVMWAVENGITAGTDEARTYFSPQRTCTRSEILQFLYAALGKPEYTIENPYSDVKDKHWYKDGAIWAYEKGLERGENGKFKAKTPCTRGYVVTYLYRYFTGNELAE